MVLGEVGAHHRGCIHSLCTRMPTECRTLCGQSGVCLAMPGPSRMAPSTGAAHVGSAARTPCAAGLSKLGTSKCPTACATEVNQVLCVRMSRLRASLQDLPRCLPGLARWTDADIHHRHGHAEQRCIVVCGRLCLKSLAICRRAPPDRPRGAPAWMTAFSRPGVLVACSGGSM